jgi:hypothetical protein
MSQSNAEANRLMEEQSLGGIGGWADLDDAGPDDYEAIMDEATAVLDQMSEEANG